MREPGFYWVCIDKREDTNEWVIALWSGEYWHFIDQQGPKIYDNQLPEIDERRIVRDEITSYDIELKKFVDDFNANNHHFKLRLV